jgi:signal peptidase II
MNLHTKPMALSRYRIPALVILLVVLLDQALKFYVKLNVYSWESIPLIGNLFTLHFAENPGMAFSMTIGGEYGKLALTLFRLFALGLMLYYLVKLARNKAHIGLLIALAFIIGGTLGNLIDCIFYGLIFSGDYSRLGQLFPPEGGYGTVFNGMVVDMLYLHFFTIEYVPDWVPFIGGGRFIFFDAVFNIADSAICVGVFLIVIFQKTFFKNEESKAPVPIA